MTWWAFSFKKSETEKTIISPDGRTKCRFLLKNSQVFYEITKDGKPVVKKSRLDFEILGESLIRDNLKLIRSRFLKHQEIIEMPWGEDRYIDNTYTEGVFYLAETEKAHRIYTIRFRVFDNAVAFRY